MQETAPEPGLSSDPPASDEERLALPLPHPFPEYLTCPHCGEPEVEIWCYQKAVQCYNCSGWVENKTQRDCQSGRICPPGQCIG